MIRVNVAEITAVWLKTGKARDDYYRRLHCWTCAAFLTVDHTGKQRWCARCKAAR